MGKEGAKMATKDTRIEQIMRKFDFGLVGGVMATNGWNWLLPNGEYRPPNVKELRQQARRLLNELVANGNKQRGSGGLIVECSKEGELGMYFELGYTYGFPKEAK